VLCSQSGALSVNANSKIIGASIGVLVVLFWRLSGGNGGQIRIPDFPEDGRLAQSGCESLAGG
jgi:hypothetical protein